jgi:hypothetical protein
MRIMSGSGQTYTRQQPVGGLVALDAAVSNSQATNF